MKRLILILGAGMALTFAGLGVGALAVVEFGLFNVTAVKPHAPAVAWITHEAMIRYFKIHALGMKTPPAFTQAQVLAGFQDYDTKCTLCHGGPGVPRATWVDGMTPTPPYILDSARQWTPAELNLIVGDGVKMTPMPGWRTTLSDGEIWNIVAFLEALPLISPRQYAAMKASSALNQTPPQSFKNGPPGSTGDRTGN